MPQTAVNDVASITKFVTSKCWVHCKHGAKSEQQTRNPSKCNKTLQQKKRKIQNQNAQAMTAFPDGNSCQIQRDKSLFSDVQNG